MTTKTNTDRMANAGASGNRPNGSKPYSGPTSRNTGQNRAAMSGRGGMNTTGETAENINETLRRLATYLKPYRIQLISVTVLVIIGTVLRVLGPMLLGRAIDNYVIPGDLAGLNQLAFWMLVIYVGAGVTNMIQGLIMIVLAQHFVADIRSEIFAHVQMLSMAYHDRHSTGDLMSRISNDSETINRTLSNGIVDFTGNILMFGGIIISMFLINWQLAIGTMIIIPIMLYITGEMTRRTRSAFRGMQRNLGRLNGVMEENITALQVVKAFAREQDAIDKFQAVSDDYRKVGVRADIITAALGPMFTTMGIITIAATSLLGGWLSIRGIVEVGVLATFVVYIMNFFRPMRQIAMLYNQLQSSLAGAERIFQVLDAKPTVTDKPDAKPLPPIEGMVKFEDVDFAYEPGKPVLADISLEAAQGETVALVGPTGAGKTTIISLLSRFYDVTNGVITIDGHDIRDVQQDSLRQQLGIVLQETYLFSATVMENIRYGRLDATDEEVIEAAKLANVDRFIRLLPDGYQTKVSERGNNFSQGQRQLLAIARAILADPRILILDEATSSVDTRTEQQIQEALLHLLEGRTAFVIAHRLSTIRNADQLLVIHDHRIAERGTHDSLLAQGGHYHDLYMSQYHRVQTLMANM
ncbi:MAG: ABC transporter ATP-binding protein [Chloroflexota bacterium]